MVDNKYISCNTNTLKRSIDTIIKVTAMLRFVSEGGEGCKKAPSLKFVTHILQ